MTRRRIYSVDLLRGLTIAAMILVNNPGSWGAVYAPLLHAPWHGYTPTDLIFPFFIFIVGCSIAFAYRRKRPSAAVYRKILVRGLKLIGLGLFLGAFLIVPPFVKTWSEIRFPGVLQRIGLVFVIAAPLSLHLRTRSLLIAITGTLVVYWGWLGYLPLPGDFAPTYDRAHDNWAMYLDQLILGSHTWKEDYDPEGLLSTLPAVATCLIGVVTGRFMMRKREFKGQTLMGCGFALLVVGRYWGRYFPINKALWTSSFVLVTAGWALMCLGVIYYFTDTQGWKIGGVFSRAGANALILFFLSSFFAKVFASIRVGETSLHGYLYETIYVQPFWTDKFASLLYALTLVALYLALGSWLYRRKIFIKV